MILAPVMMIRDLAMTTPAPAMTIQALVVFWFGFLILLHTTMNCFITMWISCLSWLVLFSVLWNGVFLKLNLVTMILFRRKVSCISCHLYNLTKWFTIFFLKSKELQREMVWWRHTTLEPSYYKDNNSIRFKLNKILCWEQKKAFNSRTQTQTEVYDIDFDKTLVNLNELSSALLHNYSTWTFMKEAAVGGLIRRHLTGRSAKAYMFCGTGLGWHSEDRSPCGTGPLWPARWLTRRGSGRDGMGKHVWHL